MEPKAKNVAMISIEPNLTIDKTIPSSHDHETNKPLQPHLKRKGSKNIFKVALFMIRRRSHKIKELLIDDESRSTWRKLMGSIRPLYLQSNRSLSKSPQTLNTMKSPSETAIENGFDSTPNLPFPSSPSSSRYGSAIGLNKMVEDEESQQEEDEEKIAKVVGEAGGDDMIDAKAEEFIADFYLQMKLQRFNVMDHHYREISRRSLGL